MSTSTACRTITEQPAESRCIRIRGARMHNLKNIDLDIPLDRLVVITGPSGSGKSSLALDTIYAEGQRQFIESLSVYARQFLHQMERPDVDLVENLPPTLSIDQRAGVSNPRSTVATVAEVYDLLRLLYARLGVPHCPNCGRPVEQQDAEQIIDQLLQLPDGARVMILAPLVRSRKGQHREVFERIRKAGLLRARVDGQVIEVDNPPVLVQQRRHNIEAVVDRIVIRQGIRARLSEAVNLAVQIGEGLLVVCHQRQRGGDRNRWEEQLFSTLLACPECKIGFEELEPRLFSFNSPYGACPSCDGLGVRRQFDVELVLPDPARSLSSGLVAPWRGESTASARRHRKWLEPFVAAAGVDWKTPYRHYKAKQQRWLLEGTGKNFPGILALLDREYQTTSSDTVRQYLDLFRSPQRCQDCGGTRLRALARSVTVGGKAIHQVAAMTVAESLSFLEQLKLPPQQRPVGEPIVREIIGRLAFLNDVGIGYVTLDRPTDSLSGGELQRVRLAASLGSGLVGVCYVLDEPSVGLHPRDNQRLIDSLRRLQQRGNTVIVVEHDEAIMRQADWLIDLGPGAGDDGGRLVAQGTPEQVAANPNSLTGGYLSGRLQITPAGKRRPVNLRNSIVLEGVTTNNLKDLTVTFPLGVFICVTGVSGSGKSSLLSQTLVPALTRRLGGVAPKPGPHKALRGVKRIDKVIEIDQKPIGRTPRSTPATYIGLFDEIRKLFAGTRQARQRGYKAGRFSFNVAGGRCEHCQGQGQQRIEMNFLPDLYVPCPHCEGKRFNEQTLQVKYRGRSIADVLQMRVDEAALLFENFPAVARLLSALKDVGLGYLELGQPSTTLSGGEAQRVKLAAELCRTSTGRTLYVLDEPTTGLHTHDIKRLLEVLGRLVDRGNTVIVIEHNLDVIKTADWIIDLGPEGGAAGGYLLAAGTPEQLAALDDNATGGFLRRALAHSAN